MPQEVTIFYAYGGNLNLDGPADGENQYSTHSNIRDQVQENLTIYGTISKVYRNRHRYQPRQ